MQLDPDPASDPIPDPAPDPENVLQVFETVIFSQTFGPRSGSGPEPGSSQNCSDPQHWGGGGGENKHHTFLHVVLSYYPRPYLQF